MWEYEVKETERDGFLEAYGREGPWVRLFRRHEGYIRTELFQDLNNRERFVTIDYWDSEEAWKTFRSAASDEFEALDQHCENYTQSEREIGVFSVLT
jgi:heme-degrading monooxygenase HmoA